MKKVIIAVILTIVITVAMFFGGDIASLFEKKVEYITVPAEKEVVVTDEFAEMVKKFKESKEGQEVLHVWATQQALEVQRKKLDEIERQTLQKEASL